MRTLLLNNANAVPGALAGVVNPVQVTEGRIAAFNADDMAAGTLNLGAALSGQQSGAVKNLVFVQGVAAGDVPRMTGIIPVSAVKRVSTRAYTAPVKQVTTVGYDGSSGSITATANEDYNLKVVDISGGSEPYPRHNFSHRSGATVTPWSVVEAIVTAINAKTNSFVEADVLADITTVALDNAVTLTVTNGSALVVGSASNHGVVAGSWIRIGHATTKTFPLYKVLSVDGANITLTRPFIGTSATAQAAGDQVTAPTTNDEAGIRLTHKVAGNSFNTALENFGDSLVPVIATTPEPGSGKGSEIVQLEKDLLGRYGEFYRLHLPTDVPLYASAAIDYDLFTITADSKVPEHISKGASQLEIILAVDATASGINLATFFGL